MKEERYTALRKRFKELDIRPFNRMVEQITERSPSYVTKVLQGRASFEPREMQLLLEFMGERQRPVDYHKFFPPLGMSLDENDFTSKVKNALKAILSEGA